MKVSYIKLEGSRSWNNPVYAKIYSTYKSMKSRCYNKNDISYHNYGGKGVTVCSRWLESFDNFIEDIDHIEGFNFDLWINGRLQLDKDIKQQDVQYKVYSKETCMFISTQKNCEVRGSTLHFWVVEPNGNISKQINLEKYTKEHNLDTRHAYNMIHQQKKRYKHVKGYQFFKHKPTESDVLKRKTFLAISPNGDNFYYYSNSYISKKYNIPMYSIQKSIREGSTTKSGWKFKLVQDGYYFLD